MSNINVPANAGNTDQNTAADDQGFDAQLQQLKNLRDEIRKYVYND